MNKMHILLKQLHLLDELPTLMNAKITKVTVNTEDCYRFFLRSDLPIPFEEYIDGSDVINAKSATKQQSII